MFDHFGSNRDVFFPRGHEVARRAHARRDARRGGAPEIDLSAGALPQVDGGIGVPASPIPEPGSVLLFAAGVGLIALVARRKLV
jgi:hypothetical protein